MTRFRKLMLDELERRNYAGSTAEAYIHAVKDFSIYYHKPPDKLGLREINGYQLHLVRDVNLAPSTVQVRMAGVRFFFVRIRACPNPLDALPGDLTTATRSRKNRKK